MILCRYFPEPLQRKLTQRTGHIQNPSIPYKGPLIVPSPSRHSGRTNPTNRAHSETAAANKTGPRIPYAPADIFDSKADIFDSVSAFWASPAKQTGASIPYKPDRAPLSSAKPLPPSGVATAGFCCCGSGGRSGDVRRPAALPSAFHSPQTGASN